MAKRNKLFWSPCAAHCLNLILCDIGDIFIHKDTICKARKVTVYIYQHSWVLNLMRKHTKGRELIRPGATRFAMSYLTLNNLEENKIGLRAMFGSEEWQRSNYSRKTEGERVMNIILADSEFWATIKYCLKSVVPLVKVLRLVHGDAKPAMGYIFEAVDRAKDQIASNYNGIQKHYKPIWDIIDERWALQLHRPLHAAAYYLNPKFHYNPEFNAYYEIKIGLYETIQKMCPSPLERESIDKQLDLFHNVESMFGMDMAIQMRNKKQLGGCKELQNLAIRILSLTCSATGCERNWSTFDQVHSKRRNRLEQQRLSALVFVKYNLQLEARHKKRILENELYDPICLSDLESDDEWITEKEDPVLPVDNSWMNVSECFEVEEGESSKKRKRGPRDISYGYTKDLAYEENNNDEVQEDDGEYVRSEDLINNGDDNLFECNLLDGWSIITVFSLLVLSMHFLEFCKP
ncbi:hypothetical protein UlMin_001258 [Ulmus minor]